MPSGPNLGEKKSYKLDTESQTALILTDSKKLNQFCLVIIENITWIQTAPNYDAVQ